MARPLLTPLLLLALAGAGAAQVASAGGLAIYHSRPVAGGTLTVVVDGADPLGEVFLHAPSVDAAPSLLAAFTDEGSGLELVATASSLVALARADEQGMVVLDVALDDPDDAGRLVALDAYRADDPAAPSASIALRVLPPLLLVPGPAGVERIDLRDGRRLLPPIPGDEGLVAAAVSRTGRTGYLLRGGGLLEARDTAAWEATPIASYPLPPWCDELARGGDGPLFAVARPDGAPYAPAGSLLVFAEGEAGLAPVREMSLEPMVLPTDGRRVALAEDGRTAYLAADDLLVREVDLAGGETRGLFTAGFVGDRAIADLALDGRRLLVLTRRPGDRTGALTVLDRDTGWVTPTPLDVDPLRLVALAGEGAQLVVPAGAGPLTRLADGLPVGRVPVPAAGGRWLDAAPLPGGGALLLLADADGVRTLRRLDPLGGLDDAAVPAPPAARLVAGDEIVVLLGAPDGGVSLFDPAVAAVRPVRGLAVDPDAPFAVLR